MRVRAKKAASEIRQRSPEPKPIDKPFRFPAPTRGLVLNENLATVGPASAMVLDNWVPTTTGIRVRGGSEKYATLSASGAVTSLFRYYTGTTEKFFGATADSVFDITTVADADAVPTADITGQSSGYYATQAFSTAGGNYLYILNGDDSPQLFDGSSWTAITGASAPAITGVTTSSLSNVWAYANRLFFVEKDSMTAWYLPVDSIGGAAQSVSLAGVFNLDGYLLFGATWSMDAGDGLDDKCVFVSSEGEVAVYQGTDPGSSSTWSLAGVYRIGKPLGKNAWTKAGGDLLIATETGLVPVSQAINKDPAALSLEAVSSPIEPYWNESAQSYTAPWELTKWPDRNLLVVAMANDVYDDKTLICNMHTGAWSRWTNLGVRCTGYFGSYVYAGGNDGIVKKLETSGSDMGTPYTCVYVGNHEGMGEPGVQKTVGQARAMFKTPHDINPLVSAQTDYLTSLASAPSSTGEISTGLWDSSLWDVATWDGYTNAVTSRWQAIGRTGSAIGPEVQLTFGVTTAPVVELVAVDMTYQSGAFAV